MPTAVVSAKADADIDGRSGVIAGSIAIIGGASLVGGAGIVAITRAVRRGDRNTARKAGGERENAEKSDHDGPPV
jgi:hypothetical protein